MTRSSRRSQSQRVVGPATPPPQKALRLQHVNELIAKSGQKTLAELDVYRYAEAPARFATAAKKPGRSTMQLQDVQTLVEWKL